jgi:hypothetical protein
MNIRNTLITFLTHCEDFSAPIKSTVHPSHCKYQLSLSCAFLDFFASPNEVELSFQYCEEKRPPPTPSAGFPGFSVLSGSESVAHAPRGCLKEAQLAIFRKSKWTGVNFPRLPISIHDMLPHPLSVRRFHLLHWVYNIEEFELNVLVRLLRWHLALASSIPRVTGPAWLDNCVYLVIGSWFLCTRSLETGGDQVHTVEACADGIPYCAIQHSTPFTISPGCAAVGAHRWYLNFDIGLYFDQVFVCRRSTLSFVEIHLIQEPRTAACRS